MINLKLTLCVLLGSLLNSISCGTGSLRIGAFNVQIFGVSKMKEVNVVEVLVDIIVKYDIILIQEIRDSSGDAIKELLEKVNENSGDNSYAMRISPRLGRSTSKEQYAFLYRDNSGLKVEHEYVFDDGDESLNTDDTKVDTFEREPYIVSFLSESTKLKRFVLAGLHISPSEAVKELQELENVFDDIKRKRNVEDIMLMGDFNADCSYVPNYQWENIPIKNDDLYTWWIGDEEDTTITNTNCAYDRFVSIGSGFEKGVVNSSAKVYKFDADFQLNQSFSLDVSDHYPIEFELRADSDISSASKESICYVNTFVLLCLSVGVSR